MVFYLVHEQSSCAQRSWITSEQFQEQDKVVTRGLLLVAACLRETAAAALPPDRPCC